MGGKNFIEIKNITENSNLELLIFWLKKYKENRGKFRVN